MKSRVAIIGTVGIPARYGGFETLAAQLADHLGKAHYITVYCSSKAYKKEERKSHEGQAKLVYLPFQANGIQSIIYDCVSILHALFRNDVLLVLGVSGGIILPFVRWFTRKKIIVSVDGIEWKRAKWGKLAAWYLWFAEMLCVKYAHANIADNESIQDYTAQRYERLSTIIEYGGDHAKSETFTEGDLEQYPFISKPYAFSVCRIEPENNIHLILEAFEDLPAHQLILVGNWKKSEYGLSLLSKYSGKQNMHLLDPIYDQRLIDAFRTNCMIYLHGHSAGGTNPSLVEAMSLSCCVFCYDVSYNRTTTQHKALYFRTAAELRMLIRRTPYLQILSLRHAMKSIASVRYTWSAVTARYGDVIHLITEGRDVLSLQAKAAQLDRQELQTLGLSHLQSVNLFYEKR
jgi:glycosyltransferase involved in cell wall biosynthesis